MNPFVMQFFPVSPCFSSLIELFATIPILHYCKQLVLHLQIGAYFINLYNEKQQTHIYKYIKSHVIILYRHVTVTVVTIITGCSVTRHHVVGLLFIMKEGVNNDKKHDYECMYECKNDLYIQD
jgi:hypothetical protein